MGVALAARFPDKSLEPKTTLNYILKTGKLRRAGLSGGGVTEVSIPNIFKIGALIKLSGVGQTGT
jgi:hypothetical protein